jgi:hypothetical protein
MNRIFQKRVRSRWSNLLRRFATLFTIGALIVGPGLACDFCVQIPRIPIDADHPAAIEVAMATREAIDCGQIEINPVLNNSLNGGSHLPIRLNKISTRQLLKVWSSTYPARLHEALRATVDIVFVDTNEVCRVDVRFGNVLQDSAPNGTADIQLFTTKPGFLRLIENGLEHCEELRLVAVEEVSAGDRQSIDLLFQSPQTTVDTGTRERAPGAIDSSAATGNRFAMN